MEKLSIYITRGAGASIRIDGKRWRVPADGLDDFRAVSGAVSSVEGGSFYGGLITGAHVSVTQRTLKFDSAVYADDLREELEKALAIGFEYTITVTGTGLWRSCTGVISALDIKTGAGGFRTSCTVTFDCADPFFHGDAQYLWGSGSDVLFGSIDFPTKKMGQYPVLLNAAVCGFKIAASGTDVLKVTITRDVGTMDWVPRQTVVRLTKDIDISHGFETPGIAWSRGVGAVLQNGYRIDWASGTNLNVGCGLLIPSKTRVEVEHVTSKLAADAEEVYIHWTPLYGGF